MPRYEHIGDVNVVVDLGDKPRVCDAISKALAAPRHSREHQSLRHQMIGSKLLGSDGVCRYCLSILTDRDCFPLSANEFESQLAAYVSSRTCYEAEAICRQANSLHFVAEFMLRVLYEAEKTEPARRWSKELRAIALLLHDPKLSDNAIRQQLSTTRKQMDRWSTFKCLRLAIRRQSGMK